MDLLRDLIDGWDGLESDRSKFKTKQKKEAKKLEEAVKVQGLPKEFHDVDTKIVWDKNSGFVFFLNADSQKCTLNEDNLEMWNCCNLCGEEDFISNLVHKEGCKGIQQL